MHVVWKNRKNKFNHVITSHIIQDSMWHSYLYFIPDYNKLGNYNKQIFRQSWCGDAADSGYFGKLQVIYDVIDCYLEGGTCQWQARCSRRCAALVGLVDQKIPKCSPVIYTLTGHWWRSILTHCPLFCHVLKTVLNLISRTLSFFLENYYQTKNGHFEFNHVTY